MSARMAVLLLRGTTYAWALASSVSALSRGTTAAAEAAPASASSMLNVVRFVLLGASVYVVTNVVKKLNHELPLIQSGQQLRSYSVLLGQPHGRLGHLVLALQLNVGGQLVVELEVIVLGVQVDARMDGIVLAAVLGEAEHFAQLELFVLCAKAREVGEHGLGVGAEGLHKTAHTLMNWNVAIGGSRLFCG